MAKKSKQREDAKTEKSNEPGRSNQADAPKEYLDVAVAATLLGRDKMRFLNACLAGDIEGADKQGVKWRVPVGTVLALAETGRDAGGKVTGEQKQIDDAVLESMEAEVAGLRTLRKKFKRVFDEVRVRADGFQHLTQSLEAAIGILDSAVAVHVKTDNKSDADNTQGVQYGCDGKNKSKE